MKYLACVLSLAISASVMSAEVDSFTNRYLPIKDSLPELNHTANKMLVEAINIANDEADDDDSCNEKKLYKELRKKFRNHISDEFSNYVIASDEIERIEVGFWGSIYRDILWYEAFVPGVVARLVYDPTAGLLKANGEMIGTDKFEHFLGSGFLYFKKKYLKNLGTREAMDIGVSAETGYMGAVSTGVMAYADLSANFNGMRFWNHMLQKDDDILGEQYNAGPYISCVDKKWVQVKGIDWANYIDAAFDEGINCSKFRSERILNKVLTRITELERQDGRSYTCPLKDVKNELSEKYGKYAPYLLNFEGHSAVPDSARREFFKGLEGQLLEQF
jgi:hypothetical protein